MVQVHKAPALNTESLLGAKFPMLYVTKTDLTWLKLRERDLRTLLGRKKRKKERLLKHVGNGRGGTIIGQED